MIDPNDKKCPYYKAPCLRHECHAYREHGGVSHHMEDYVVVIKKHPLCLRGEEEWWGYATKKNSWTWGRCSVMKDMMIYTNDEATDIEPFWRTSTGISSRSKRRKIYVSKNATREEIIEKIQSSTPKAKEEVNV